MRVGWKWGAIRGRMGVHRGEGGNLTVLRYRIPRLLEGEWVF